jgi:hypothetical protein
MWVVGSLIVVSGIVGLAVALYFIGKQQGKW